MLYAYVAIAIILVPVVLSWLNRTAGWEIRTYTNVTGAIAILGIVLFAFTPSSAGKNYLNWWQISGLYIMCLAAAAIVYGVVEFGLLRLLGLFRLGAITRVTYYEGLLQPFTLILIVLGIALITIGAFFPYFTLNEDHKMYCDIAISLAFIFTLPIMIYTSTKVIDEEIENRTMLTLMSKPIARWQVILGKYLGVLLLCFVVIASLGIMVAVCSYLRYFDDKLIDYRVATGPQKAALDFENYHALRALAPALFLQFLQIATLAAVSVAISTRFGLALNITIVIILYMVANLVRYATAADLPGPVHDLIAAVAGALPGLSYLDLNQRLIYGNFNYDNSHYIVGLPSYGQIWEYVGMAFAYSVFYIAAALSFGIALFRTRELS